MKVHLGSTEIGLARYLGLWSAIAVVFAIQIALADNLDGTSLPWFVYLRWSMIIWYTWAALTPLVFLVAWRHPIRPPLRLHRLGMHLLTSIGITFGGLVICALVSTPFEPSGFMQQLRYFLAQHCAIGLLIYWAVFAVAQAMHSHAENVRREIETSRLATELAQSRLQVLKTQLQPHFLFNTLHAIATLLDEDTLSAEDMLLRLSELLRAFLEEYDGQEITLRRELELLDLYLGIQNKRFKDRLTTRIYVAPDTLDCAVPSLILQPIVENAIRHGIGQRIGSDRIEIESRREGDQLCIDVRNGNSTLETEGAAAGHGIGLSNTRLRLKELYGDAADIRLDMVWPQGVACRIRLPFREMEEADDMPEHAPA